jgi:hypothetical protein
VRLRKNCAFNLHGRLSFRCAIQIIDDHSLKVVGASLRTVADQMLDHTAFARDDKYLRNRRRPGFIFGAFQKRRRQPAVVVPDGVISLCFFEKLDYIALIAFLIGGQADNFYALVAILLAQFSEFRNESDACFVAALPSIGRGGRAVLQAKENTEALKRIVVIFRLLIIRKP